VHPKGKTEGVYVVKAKPAGSASSNRSPVMAALLGFVTEKAKKVSFCRPIEFPAEYVLETVGADNTSKTAESCTGGKLELVMTTVLLN